MRTAFVSAGLCALATTARAQDASLLPSPPTERCVAAAPADIGSATLWLNRAAARVLPPNAQGTVLRYRASHDQPLWEQSDRPYEPYIPSAAETVRWYDITTGVEGRQTIARLPTASQYPSQLFAAAAVRGGPS